MALSNNELFKLRNPLSKRTSTILMVAGIVFILGIWILLTTPMLDNPDYLTQDNIEQQLASGEINESPSYNPELIPIAPRSSLPHPWRVVTSYKELFTENELVKNAGRSIGLNLGGYIKALLISLPFGFLIGLIPLFRGAFQKSVDAIRFIPLTAVTVVFIVWFGIGAPMKVNFLAFGIIIYLLPVIVQRIDEVEDVYLKTVYTIGANAWETFKTVYWPSVVSRLSDDIRILTAISWTYIIVAETSGDQGGLGSLIYRTGQRMGRIDKTFAVLILIILIGVLQDRIFVYLDRKFFPHKYQTKTGYASEVALKEVSVWDAITDFAIDILGWMFLILYVLITINEFLGFVAAKPLEYLFGDIVWPIHFIFITILIYKIKGLIDYKKKK